MNKELENARRYLERSLALKRMTHEEENIPISDTLYLIGKVQGKSGDLDDSLQTLKDGKNFFSSAQAQKYFLTSLLSFSQVTRIRKMAEGPDSKSLAGVINDVGVIQLRKGQYTRAEKCFLEALRIWKLHLDRNNEKVAETLVNLRDIEYAKRNYDAAMQKLINSLDTFQNQFGANHPSVALVHLKLGRCQRQKEDFDDAPLVSFEKALAIRTEAFGVETVPVAGIYTDIGSIYLKISDFSKARHCLGESLNILRSKLPHDSLTAETFYHLGKVMENMNYTDEALTYFQDAL